MKKNKLATAISTLILTSTLAACDGGGDSSGTGSTTDVISSGVITQFGSVYVNGVRYHTGNSSIVSRDNGDIIVSKPSDDTVKNILGLGQIITVVGQRNDDGTTGTADTITFDNELVAQVSSVSDADGSFEMLAQTISVTPETVIDDSIIEIARNGAEVAEDLTFGDPALTETLSELIKIGTVYVISGFPSQNGFEATRIEDIDTNNASFINSSEAEVKGIVSNLNPGVSFMLNNLIISYDNTDLDDEDFATGSDLEDGMFVEVHGTATSTTSVDATRIEREDDLHDEDFSDGEIEFEGVVQKIVADTSGTGGTITMNGIDIQVDDISGFSEGLKVEIKGILQGDGSISLIRIKDEAEDTVRTEDTISSVSTSGFTTRLGLMINPSDRSRLENDVIDDDDNLTIATFLSTITAGTSRVEARGFPLNDATVWTRLEIEEDNDNNCRLRGAIANISGDATNFSFEIEGISIDVDNVPNHNFENFAGIAIGKANFFDQLDEGDIVQATSDSAGTGCQFGVLTAREVEFEPDNKVLYGSSDDSSSSSTSSSSQLVGTASNVTDSSFDLAGETILVNDDTVIDDSILEEARGVELDNEETLGQAPETLSQLIDNGMGLEVIVDRSGAQPIATSIEDL